MFGFYHFQSLYNSIIYPSTFWAILFRLFTTTNGERPSSNIFPEYSRKLFQYSPPPSQTVYELFNAAHYLSIII